MLSFLNREAGKYLFRSSRSAFPSSKRRHLYTDTRNRRSTIHSSRVKNEARRNEERLSKAVVWDMYLNPQSFEPTPVSDSDAIKTVSQALNQNLDSEWQSHELLKDLQSMLQSPVESYLEIESFLNELQLSTLFPTPELVAKLMELGIKLQVFEKCVEFFIWGRDAGQLPPATSLLALLKATRHLESWKFIRERLRADLVTYYPTFIEQKDKLSEVRQHGVDVRFDKHIPELQGEALHYAHIIAKDGQPKTSFTVDWVDFVCQPSVHTGAPIVTPSTISSDTLANILKRDTAKNETRASLKKHTGFLMGSRQKRLREDIRGISDDELRAIEMEDNVVLRCVLEELVSRGHVEEAMALLQQEAEKEDSYPINHEPFLTLVNVFKDQKNVRGIMKLLEMMMEHNIDPDVGLINSLLDLHVKLGHLDEACRLWEMFPSFNVTANASTINVLVNMLVLAVETNKHIDLSLSSVLKLTHSLNLDLNDAVYSSLLHYSVLVKNFVFGKMVFSKIKSPNFQSLSQMLLIYCDENDQTKFSELYHTLERHHGSLIGFPQLRLVLRAKFKAGQPELFLTALRHQMLKYGHRPTIAQMKSFVALALRYGYFRTVLELETIRADFMSDLPVPVTYFKPFTKALYLSQAKPPMPEQLLHNSLRRFNLAEQRPAVSPKELKEWNKTVKTWLSRPQQLRDIEENARSMAFQPENEDTEEEFYTKGKSKFVRFKRSSSSHSII